MSGEVSLNVNGEKLVLKEGSDIKALKSKEAQIIACIFDDNGDGKLQKGELETAKNFNSGIFSVASIGKNMKVNYTEDVDNNGQPEYVSDWIMNDRGKYTFRTKDSDGDGKVDYKQTWQYNENDEVISTDIDYDGDDMVDERLEFEYDEKGKTVKQTENHYEDNQIVFSRTLVNADGEILEKTVDYTEKDENGNPIPQYTVPNGWSLNMVFKAFGEEEE